MKKEKELNNYNLIYGLSQLVGEHEKDWYKNRPYIYRYYCSANVQIRTVLNYYDIQSIYWTIGALGWQNSYEFITNDIIRILEKSNKYFPEKEIVKKWTFWFGLDSKHESKEFKSMIDSLRSLFSNRDLFFNLNSINYVFLINEAFFLLNPFAIKGFHNRYRAAEELTELLTKNSDYINNNKQFINVIDELNIWGHQQSIGEDVSNFINSQINYRVGFLNSEHF